MKQALLLEPGAVEGKRFTEAQAYLESLIRKLGSKRKNSMGLERTQALLGLLGNPETNYPIIHVGGTNGKGSTCVLAASILQEAGYKVGLHLSPHLQDITERVIVNGAPIARGEFIALVERLKPLVEKIKRETPWGAPSYFEVLVAMALLHFAEQEVDVAVIEVGLGGRLDATNVVSSRVSVLTNVELDHTNLLGNTVEEIAMEKVEIFKKGSRVVAGAAQESVRKIVQAKASREDCELACLGKEVGIEKANCGVDGSVFDLRVNGKALRRLKLSLLGEHQVRNAALAVAAVEGLKDELPVGGASIRAALKNAFFPGRLEVASRNPLVLLDGAHNPSKAKALAATLQSLFPGKKITFVFAMKGDKDFGEVLKELKPVSEAFVLTEFTSLPETAKGPVPAGRIATKLSTHTPDYSVFVEKNPRQAIITA